MPERLEDPRKTDSYETQLLRFKGRERRLDAGCAVVGILWVVLTRIPDIVPNFWWAATFAGIAALGGGWWALRRGNGRLANRVNEDVFGAKDD